MTYDPSEEQPVQEQQDDRAVKNAIFATKQLVEQQRQQTPFHQPLPSSSMELGLEIETAFAPLPTSGLVYDQDHPLHKTEEVEFMKMTAKQENILMNRSLVRKGTVINELIKSSLINKKIDVLSLLTGDRLSLLFAIRNMGIGDEFTQKITCPECSQSTEEDYKISDFKIKELDLTVLKQVEPFKNLFEFTLPKTKKQVLFKFLDGHDEEQIVQQVEARKRKKLPEETITTRLFHSIVSIDGNQDRGFIAKFVQHMPAIDSRALRVYMEKHEPGIDTSQEFTCSSCGYTEDMTPPLGVTFLWPDA